MAFIVNSVSVSIQRDFATLTANVTIDAYPAQDFRARVHVDATGKKATLGGLIKLKRKFPPNRSTSPIKRPAAP